ncbi:MAG TPA: hypothetical protein VID28_22635 [Methylomirabilota bacterium]|jgi:hypothetical protein
MNARMGWIIGAASLMIAGFAVLPAPAQDPKAGWLDTRELGSNNPENSKNGPQHRKDRKELDASRERLRDAYRSGDPAAIKAARESYQKQRGEAKERDGSAPRPK